MAGTQCRDDDGCDGLISPVAGFGCGADCVITGGFVFRGVTNPSLGRTYLFADYCSGNMWVSHKMTMRVWPVIGPIETRLRISSFGEDAVGEFYLVVLQAPSIAFGCLRKTIACRNSWRLHASAVGKGTWRSD
jgi:hypothetical protein